MTSPIKVPNSSSSRSRTNPKAFLDRDFRQAQAQYEHKGYAAEDAEKRAQVDIDIATRLKNRAKLSSILPLADKF